MDPHSLVAFLSVAGLTLLLVVACLIYSVWITVSVARSGARATVLPQLRYALFGGVFFTSSPFWWVVLGVFGAGTSASYPSELFSSFMTPLGGLRFTLSWLPNFVIGYAVFALLWSLVNRNARTKSRGKE